ncbi:hypothetical protein V6N11_047304 [Hibiscus sabdariffa]|uniref:Uncharacterized protein n=1 Tax=Hibiscus sabdariffa TaxID=183260 RepID=A0ABR2PBJ4_9ROSI
MGAFPAAVDGTTSHNTAASSEFHSPPLTITNTVSPSPNFTRTHSDDTCEDADNSDSGHRRTTPACSNGTVNQASEVSSGDDTGLRSHSEELSVIETGDDLFSADEVVLSAQSPATTCQAMEAVNSVDQLG